MRPASRSHSPIGCLSRRAEPQGFSVPPALITLFFFQTQPFATDQPRRFFRRCSSASLFGVALRRRQLVCPITSDFSSHPFQATPTLTLTHVAFPACVESTSKSK